MKLFNPDNPVVRFFDIVANIVIINVITLVCCIPLFTMGAALTADYYVCLKMLRDEDSGIVKLYFKSFKENFRQALILEIIILAFTGLPAYLLAFVSSNFDTSAGGPRYAVIILAAVIALAAFCLVLVFPALSRFGNTVGGILKTGFYMSFSNPFRTLLIMLITAAPFVLAYNFPVLIPVVVLCGVTLPAYTSMALLKKVVKKLEDMTYEANNLAVPGSEDEHIFNDTEG